MAYRVAFNPYKAIIQHHYAHNDHHPEFDANGINAMNLLQITEMLCDWRAAASRNPELNFMESLKIQKNRFGISDQLFLIICNTVDSLGWD
jgi:hypothetical protein